MKILVTGKNGFIAKNVIEYFKDEHEILAISHYDSDKLLEKYCSECDLVFHLAAVQRSNVEEEFWKGNVEYTRKLIYYLKANINKLTIFFSTSINIDKPSIFAQTKLEAEYLLREYMIESNNKVFFFKLNHIFGKYGKPNFNNVISTFCYNIANGLPLTIIDPSIVLSLTYIDDLLNEFTRCIMAQNTKNSIYVICSQQYQVSLGEIAMILGRCKNNNIDLNNQFEKKIYQTYKWYCK